MATGNEDLFAFGYDAENYGKPAGHHEGYWGGDQGELTVDENGNYVQARPTGVQQDVNRYRQMGADAANRAAYKGNYNNFNAAGSGFRYGQGRAVGAMDLQQAAAEGRAPSAAEIAGKSAIDQSLTAQLSAGASTRGGPLAQAAATRNAQNGANAFRQTAIQGIQAGRANEMANARNSYAGSTFQFGQNQLGMGQLELGRTGQEQQADLFQRQLNQQGQQFAENKAFDTKSQGLASDFARQGQQFQSIQADRQNNMAERQQDFNEVVGSVNAGTNTGSMVGKLGQSGSDVRMKTPVQPAGRREVIDLDENENDFDADAYDRRMADNTDIFRGDPYDDETNAMLDDRQRQNGQQQPADWLNAYIEKDQAPPPAAARPKPKMSYEAGWDDTSRDDDEKGYAPGTTDYQKYAFGGTQDSFSLSDEQAKREIGELEREAKAGRMPAKEAEEKWRGSLARGEARMAEKDAFKTKDDADPKMDWDAIDRAAAKEPRRQSAERTFRRDTSQDQKKVRRTFEDKAGKDADDMMAGMKASLDRGPSVGPREEVDLDGKDEGRLVYSDKEAKKAAFEAGKKTALKPSAQKSIEPITVEGSPVNYEKAGVPTGPTRHDDEIFNLYSQGKGPISPQQYMDNVESSERWNNYVRAARDKPVNLQGDAYVPPAFQPSGGPKPEEERMSYSDERTKTEAAHALEGHDYKYKDEFTPPEQEDGEVNHGPMAQAMEKNPLTRTAVKKDPRGMRMVDMNKLVKVHSSLIDHLQDEIEDLKGVRNG